MGVPASEVGYTAAMASREGPRSPQGHVVALDKKKTKRSASGRASLTTPKSIQSLQPLPWLILGWATAWER